MKKRFVCVFLLVALVVSLFAGCGQTETAEPTMGEEENKMLPMDKEYNILFIGNSYTFFNDMPTVYFQTMANACGYRVTVSSITKGAYTLEKFADPSDNYGKLVASALAQEGVYDYVILQEQSVLPARDPAAFYSGVRKLVASIRQTGAEPVLYATWGRQTGSDKLTELNMTNETMTWALAAAYATIGEELQIPVCHAGLAFLDINTNTEINLYNADNSHPSHLGSYLAAMTLLGGIFGVDPETAPFQGPITDAGDAALRKAAKVAVFETPVIEEKYMTAASVVG